MKPIKRIEDLTNQEILSIAINSADYNNIIDLECAHAGIGLLPEHPGPEPVKSAMKPEGALYKLGSWGFTSMADAQAVYDLMVSKGLYREETMSNVNVIIPMTESHYYWPEIKKVSAYFEPEYKQVKKDLEVAASLYNLWKEKNNAYESLYKERKAILESFRKKKELAANISEGIARLRYSLKRYLDLSQNSYPIAISFLKEADKHGEVAIKDDNVFYVCGNNERHLVMTREQHQQEQMGNALGVSLVEPYIE